MIESPPFQDAIAASGSPAWLIREPEGPYTPAAKPRLLDRARDAIRTRRMSPRTEEAYVHWIRRFILFHGKRHPSELGPPEITAFLTALAVRRHVSASTQNQALAALLFLYREVLGCDLTRCATASLRTCWLRGTTFAPSRSCSGTRT